MIKIQSADADSKGAMKYDICKFSFCTALWDEGQTRIYVR